MSSNQIAVLRQQLFDSLQEARRDFEKVQTMPLIAFDRAVSRANDELAESIRVLGHIDVNTMLAITANRNEAVQKAKEQYDWAIEDAAAAYASAVTIAHNKFMRAGAHFTQQKREGTPDGSDY